MNAIDPSPVTDAPDTVAAGPCDHHLQKTLGLGSAALAAAVVFPR